MQLSKPLVVLAASALTFISFANSSPVSKASDIDATINDVNGAISTDDARRLLESPGPLPTQVLMMLSHPTPSAEERAIPPTTKNEDLEKRNTDVDLLASRQDGPGDVPMCCDRDCSICKYNCGTCWWFGNFPLCCAVSLNNIGGPGGPGNINPPRMVNKRGEPVTLVGPLAVEYGVMGA